MTHPCLLAVSIDVECDKDDRWDVRRPLSFAGVAAAIGERLHPIFESYGVRPTYLISPEVLRHEASAALLNGLNGCELGSHLHPEFVFTSEGVERTTTVPCHLPDEEERRCLEALTALFTEVCGRPPRSYRAGRFGAGARSLGTLADLGYEVDTSVTPHKLWDYDLDFRGAPDSPYYPAAADIGQRAEQPGGLVEIPVTLRPSPAPAVLREATAQLARSRVGFTRDWAKWARGPFWFRPGWSKRKMLVDFVRRAARGEFGGTLNMMFHNVDMMSGCSPNAPSEVCVRTALDDLKAVFEAALAVGARFATLTEIRDSFVSTWQSS